MRGAPKCNALLSASKFERLVMVGAVKLQATTGRAEVERTELASLHISLCQKVYGFAPTNAEHEEVVASLCLSKLLTVADSPGWLRMLVQAEDVKDMTQRVPELSSLFLHA